MLDEEDSEVVGLLGEVPIHIYTESLDRISETSEEVESRTSSSMGGEEVGDSNKVKLYKRRWYIITVFSLFCLLQVSIHEGKCFVPFSFYFSFGLSCMDPRIILALTSIDVLLFL